jgi:diguanylate cyclase (GGDEF)-like protein
VLFLDLDDFKTVNDTWGHAAGDDLLRQVAELIGPCLRPSDVAARLGGDEFAICLPELHDAHEAAAVATRLLDTLGAPLRIDGHHLAVRVSVGVALADRPGRTAEDLLRCADVAMYVAKVKGKGRYEVYEEGLRAELDRRAGLEAALRRAVVRGDLHVLYQPVLDVATGTVVGAEALARWTHPERGLLVADDFVPLAEDIGVVGRLGYDVMRTACAQLAEWRRLLPADRAFGVSVNVSAKQLRHASFVAEVAAILAETGTDAGALTVEVHERTLAGDGRAWLPALTRLRELGVRVSVDDFGGGDAALTYLQDLPVDALKLAPPFVDRLDRDTADAAVGRALVALGRDLGVEVVAEGVERPGQLRELRLARCARAQGLLFGAPMTATELTALLLRPAAVPLPRESRADTASYG